MRGLRTWGKLERIVPVMPSRLRPSPFLLVAALWLALALVLSVGAGTGRAQRLEPAICPLGATPAEIDRLYGPVLRHNARVRHHEILDDKNASIFTGDLHGRRDLIIRTVYHKDHCVLLEYTRVAAALSAADVDAALAASAQSFAWEMGKDSTADAKLYHRTDGKAVAHWAVGYDGSLLVSSEESDNGFGKDFVR